MLNKLKEKGLNCNIKKVILWSDPNGILRVLVHIQWRQTYKNIETITNMKPPIYQKYVERFIGVVNYYRNIRGPIDKISTVFCQNPTFASTWQKILSQRKASKSRTTTDASPSGSLLNAKSPISYYYNSALAMQKLSVY